MLRTFTNHKKMQHIIRQIPEAEREEALARGYTIGGMILFPGVRVQGKQTINQARGTHPRIQDRFDLTLECIRRHFVGEESPLSHDIGRYADFFALFGDFPRYVEFFLLQDLVSHDYSSIRFWALFDNFTSSPLPADIGAYRRYRAEMLTCIDARNLRISTSCNSGEAL